jgi:predicted AAA+ superfamily ATPase
MGVNMKFKRKIYNNLLDWKNNRLGKTALLIEGARRVGKSFVVTEFAKQEYKSYVIIDFSVPRPLTLDAIINTAYDLDGLFNRISIEYKVQLHPRETLIIFDEVQLCPKARQLIKHLVADGRYDYIETGSLVSLKTNIDDILIPSEEERLSLNPMDFEEFCWAMGDEVTVSFARECYLNRKALGAIHDTVLKRYCEYLCVGGMPQAVEEYVKTKDYSRTDKVKRSILDLYRNDIGKFAGNNAAKVRSIFNEIPGQLTKKDKKYSLASLDKAARMRTYEDSFDWLSDAKIINPSYNATDPTVGMALSSDFATRKIYMADTGLLLSHALQMDNVTETELYEAIFTGEVYFNNGMIAENAVAQSLVASGKSLFFYSRHNRETHRNEIEIDFLIRKDGAVTPIEVKSGKYRSHASLDKFSTKFADRIGERIILYTKDVAERDGVIHLPIYMAMFL